EAVAVRPLRLAGAHTHAMEVECRQSVGRRERAARVPAATGAKRSPYVATDAARFAFQSRHQSMFGLLHGVLAGGQTNTACSRGRGRSVAAPPCLQSATDRSVQRRLLDATASPPKRWR